PAPTSRPAWSVTVDACGPGTEREPLPPHPGNVSSNRADGGPNGRAGASRVGRPRPATTGRGAEGRDRRPVRGHRGGTGGRPDHGEGRSGRPRGRACR